jgi:hypothetical protein
MDTLCYGRVVHNAWCGLTGPMERVPAGPGAPDLQEAQALLDAQRDRSACLNSDPSACQRATPWR